MFSIVDIETTGGSPQQSRVTEIAIYITDGVQLIDQFETLINPEQVIPSFITKLTGISNEMVIDAPKFQDISGQIARLTKDTVFVAHNVAFDYGMLCHEYRELGMEFHRNVLCTVKSSRRLLPGHESYSLGNICKDLGIALENRHRAAGDAFATMKLFHLLINKEKDELLNLIEDGLPRITGDPRADELLKNVPESTGVYYLLDHNAEVVYVGSGTNIRKKVMNHFTKRASRVAFELRNTIAGVNFSVTGSELLSQIMEMAEIKRIRPIYNRRIKSSSPTIEEENQTVRYIIDKGPDRFTKSIIRVTQEQVGWGFFPAEQTIYKNSDFDLFIQFAAIGKEFPAIIEQYLEKGRVEAVLNGSVKE